MRFRPISLFAAVLLLIVLIWSAWWASSAQLLRRTVLDWAAREQAAGSEVEFSRRIVDGFPGTISLQLGKIRWRRSDGVQITADSLTVEAAPWAPLDLSLTAARGLTVRQEQPSAAQEPPAEGQAVPDRVLPDLSARELSATGEARLAVSLTQTGRPVHLQLTLAGFAAIPAHDPAGAVRVDQLSLTLDRPGYDATGDVAGDVTATVPVDGSTADSQGTSTLPVTLTAALAVSGVQLPEGRLPVQRIDDLVLSARLLGPLAILDGASFDVVDLRRWSEAGGTLELELTRLAVLGGDLRGDATLALDRDLQPIGAGSLRVGGHDRLLRQLRTAGIISEGRAAMAGAALGMLARPDTDGVSTVSMPMTLQNRRLNLGPFKLVEVPMLAWPTPVAAGN
jgi:hypothetical protein